VPKYSCQQFVLKQAFNKKKATVLTLACEAQTYLLNAAEGGTIIV
jgi:hypothetical protein